MSLGHFARHLGLSDDSGPPDQLTDCTRAAQLIELCLGTGHVGPGCYAACLTFSPWLASLGEIEQAVRLAEVGHGWTERRRSSIPPTWAVAEDLLYVEALASTGQFDRAGVLLLAVHAAAVGAGRSLEAAKSLLLLARVAGETNNRDLWAYLSEHLPRAEPHLVSRATRLATLLTHAQVAWQEGEFDGARRAVDEMLTLVGTEASTHESGWRDQALLFRAALARFESGGTGRSPAALARVQQFEFQAHPYARPPVITRSHAGALLDAVDALIDDDDIARAEELMDRARSAITGRLAEIATLECKRASIEGRLALHQHLRDPEARAAHAHLERAWLLLQQAAAGYRHAQATRPLSAVLVNLSTVEHRLGLDSSAAATAEEAVQVDLEQFGPDHPETLRDLAWWMQLRAWEAAQRLHPQGGGNEI